MKKEQTSNTADNQQLNIAGVKCRFFVQYWGVKCMYVGGIGLVEIGTGGWNLKHPDFFLQLKPLSKLTDDDAIEYFDILWYETHKSKSKEFKIEYGKDWANSILSERFGLIPSNILHGIDFLRSKGYVIPFMEYSVEMLVDVGWVRLS
jgi:hypothetical protein